MKNNFYLQIFRVFIFLMSRNLLANSKIPTLKKKESILKVHIRDLDRKSFDQLLIQSFNYSNYFDAMSEFYLRGEHDREWF